MHKTRAKIGAGLCAGEINYSDFANKIHFWVDIGAHGGYTCLTIKFDRAMDNNIDKSFFYEEYKNHEEDPFYDPCRSDARQRGGRRFR